VVRFLRISLAGVRTVLTGQVRFTELNGTFVDIPFRWQHAANKLSIWSAVKAEERVIEMIPSGPSISTSVSVLHLPLCSFCDHPLSFCLPPCLLSYLSLPLRFPLLLLFLLMRSSEAPSLGETLRSLRARSLDQLRELLVPPQAGATA
jgi:hypothetical protein